MNWIDFSYVDAITVLGTAFVLGWCWGKGVLIFKQFTDRAT